MVGAFGLLDGYHQTHFPVSHLVENRHRLDAFKLNGIRAFARLTAVTPSLERLQWLEQAVEALRPRFTEVGYVIPENIRVSIGWPKQAASSGRIGECWLPKQDQHGRVVRFAGTD